MSYVSKFRLLSSAQGTVFQRNKVDVLYIRGICVKNSLFRRVSHDKRPLLWSSGQSSLLLTQRSWVRFPGLRNFLRRSGSGTRPTQPREHK
jgi:hypothetical protein